MLRLIVILSVAGLSLCQCNIRSCRRCAASGNSCEVCNNQLDYVPAGSGKCSSAYIEQCHLIKDTGGCAVCRSGFVPIYGVCRQTTVANCVMFSDQDCVRCATNYYLQNKACFSMTTQTTVDNCQSYIFDAQTPTAPKCAVCKVGHYLINNSCVPNPSSCITPIGFSCAACTANYFVNPPKINYELYSGYTNFYNNTITKAADVLCLANTDANCLTASGVSVCSVCKSGFYPNNGVCTAVTTAVANCAVYSSATACSQCADGYYFANNACAASPGVIANCVYFSAIDVCAQCANGFYPSGRQCLAVPQANLIANCVVHTAFSASTTTATCGACAAGFFLSNNACVAISQTFANCQFYTVNTSGVGSCLHCAGAFYWNGSACTAITQSIANCAFYATATTCAQCNPAYYLSNAGANCNPVILTNCNIYKADGSCYQCATNYYLSSGACAQAGTSLTNCLVYATTSTCLICVNNYMLSNSGTCVVSPIPNCAVYSSNTQCQHCTKNYFYNSVTNSCDAATSDANCGRHSAASTCSFCSGDFFLTSPTCTAVTPPLISNCLSYTSGTACGRCAVDFKVASSSPFNCVSTPTIASCAFYAPDGTCSECLTTHFLQANACVQRTTTAITNCASYDAAGNCNRCLSGYYLSANTCTQATAVTNCYEYSASGCAYCATGFILANNACQSFGIIANCVVYATFNTCLLCENNTSPSSGSCAAIALASQITNCGAYSATSPLTCARCVAGFYLISNVCVAFGSSLPNCLYAATSFGCATCNAGFYPLNAYCTAVTSPVTSCSLYNANQGCASCSSGFFLSGSSCTAMPTEIANCRIYSSLTACSACAAGYYVNNNVCTAVSSVTGCLYYSSATLCSQCNANFLLSADATTCIPNCLTASGNSCSACAANYYPVSGSCVQVTGSSLVANCSLYSANGICSQCAPSYYLSVNTCVLAQEHANCAALSRVENCLLCVDGFVPINGRCTAVPAASLVSDCGTYSTAVVNGANVYYCEVCKDSAYQTAYRGGCVLANPIYNQTSFDSVRLAAWLAMTILLALLY